MADVLASHTANTPPAVGTGQPRALFAYNQPATFTTASYIAQVIPAVQRVLVSICMCTSTEAAPRSVQTQMLQLLVTAWLSVRLSGYQQVARAGSARRCQSRACVDGAQQQHQQNGNTLKQIAAAAAAVVALIPEAPSSLRLSGCRCCSLNWHKALTATAAAATITTTAVALSPQGPSSWTLSDCCCSINLAPGTGCS